MDATAITAASSKPAGARATRLLRHLALALFAVLALAPAAGAVTVVGVDGAPLADPFQRWADRSAMPTPPGSVTVSRDASTCDHAAACTRQGTTAIWFGAGADRGDFIHELGHQFDYHVMNDAARAAFQRVMGLTGPWRSRSANPAHERFAEAYRMCARDPRHPDESRMGYLYEPTVRQHRRVCTLIKRTGTRSADSAASKATSAFSSIAIRLG